MQQGLKQENLCGNPIAQPDVIFRGHERWDYGKRYHCPGKKSNRQFVCLSGLLFSLPRSYLYIDPHIFFTRRSLHICSPFEAKQRAFSITRTVRSHLVLLNTDKGKKERQAQRAPSGKAFLPRR